jgi:hypothetical protein
LFLARHCSVCVPVRINTSHCSVYVPVRTQKSVTLHLSEVQLANSSVFRQHYDLVVRRPCPALVLLRRVQHHACSHAPTTEPVFLVKSRRGIVESQSKAWRLHPTIDHMISQCVREPRGGSSPSPGLVKPIATSPSLCARDITVKKLASSPECTKLATAHTGHGGAAPAPATASTMAAGRRRR